MQTLWLFFLLVLPACVSVNYAREHMDRLAERAAFDLGCAPAALTTTCFAATPGGFGGPDLCNQAGVQGCGHRAVYLREAGTYPAVWIMDSASTARRDPKTGQHVQGSGEEGDVAPRSTETSPAAPARRSAPDVTSPTTPAERRP